MNMRYVERRLAELGRGRVRHVSGAQAEEFLKSMGASDFNSLRPHPNPPPKRKIWTREKVRDYQKARRKTVTGKMETARSNLRAVYSLTLEEYESLYASQSGACAICGGAIVKGFDPIAERSGTRGPLPNSAHVDHDHACCAGRKSCGRCIRGLLCGRCNAAIGHFRDDPDLIRRAADYVTTHRR